MQRSTSKLYNSQRGSAYFFVMFAIVVMSISITAAAKQWKTVVQREKEADLLMRGIEIQGAISNYSAREKKGRVIPGELYPLTLEELTKGPKPLLRKVYKDPITGEDWEYVRHTDGRIKGVRSRAKIAPIKQHEFPPAVVHFDGLTQYYDWVFQHRSASTSQIPQAASGEVKKEGGETPSSTPQVQPSTGATPAQPPSAPVPALPPTPQVQPSTGATPAQSPSVPVPAPSATPQVQPPAGPTPAQ